MEIPQVVAAPVPPVVAKEPVVEEAPVPEAAPEALPARYRPRRQLIIPWNKATLPALITK